MTRPRPRRTIVTLVLAPLLCGVLVAGLVSVAWLALGSPVPARAAVWMQVVKTGEARDTGAPDQRSSCSRSAPAPAPTIPPTPPTTRACPTPYT